MTARIVVAGTGKMARNIGRFLAGRERAVTFASRSADQLADLERWMHKRMRRAATTSDPLRRAETRLIPSASPSHATSPRGAEGSTGASPSSWDDVDVAIEATREDRDAKTRLFASLAAELPPDALLASSSSSILPGEIHPGCVGIHFFYPVELTGFVEIVVAQGTAPARIERARSLCEELGLRVVLQAERSAFVANRLLLPLQSECARLLCAGAPAPSLDEATASELLPVGQLSLMDQVGLDVLGAAVGNYLARMTGERAEPLRPLEALVRTLVAADCLGDKCGRGLLAGGPRSWGEIHAQSDRPPHEDRASALPDPVTFRALFVNACLLAVEESEVDRADLPVLLEGLFGGAEAFDRAVRDEGRRMVELLEGLFAQRRAWYCKPAASLRARIA